MSGSTGFGKAPDSEPHSATVPLDTTRDAGDAPERETPDSEVTSVRGSVLIVDDEPAVGRVLIRALGKFHQASAVTSGREALDRIAAGERFDAILCDVRMPEFSGLEVHARLMAFAPDQAGKMIFMTGDGLRGEAWEMLDRLQRPILEKPFPLQLVRTLVGKQIGKK